jgi:hypothetical protein
MLRLSFDFYLGYEQNTQVAIGSNVSLLSVVALTVDMTSRALDKADALTDQ